MRRACDSRWKAHDSSPYASRRRTLLTAWEVLAQQLQCDTRRGDYSLRSRSVGRDDKFPPCSPDLNLIENVFGIMVERMSSEKLDTIDKLVRAIKDTWNSLTRSDILNLYSSWGARLAAVRDAEGGPTRF